MEINEFINSLQELKIEINEDKLSKLETYYELLVLWNQKMNLTGITEKKDVYLKHFYDSATLYRVIDLMNYKTLCDIGTGAGFPGLVLKILFPHLHVTLVDSLRKRTIFLQEVVDTLQLNNVSIYASRAEEYAIINREKFDIVTSRAVASLPILLEYSIPLVKVDGYCISMKGNVEEELQSISNTLEKLDTSYYKKDTFRLPIENSVRTLLIFQKKRKTNKTFPRKYGEMKKKPL